MSPRYALALALALCLAAAPALAHRQAAGPAPPGSIAIASLTHGQMKVIAQHLHEIRALAEAQVPTDPTMRRLQNYVSLQSFACLWGWVPGSVEDETSPFNECAHAYLAGAQALLLHLRQMPQVDRRALDALVARIETDMLANDAALSLCRFSDEPFNTAEVIWPRWRGALVHAPTALTLGAALALAATLAAALRRAWAGGAQPSAGS